MLKSSLVVDDDPDDLSLFVKVIANLSPGTVVHPVSGGDLVTNGWECQRDSQLS